MNMLICMRTTLNLPDALVEAAKQRARAEGRTLTSVIEESLRKILNEPASASVQPMPTYGQPGQNGLLVDLHDKEAVRSLLDDDRPWTANETLA